MLLHLERLARQPVARHVLVEAGAEGVKILLGKPGENIAGGSRTHIHHQARNEAKSRHAADE
eukprot:710604-Pleurochrysis_carterae.AAC.1